jgi:integrase
MPADVSAQDSPGFKCTPGCGTQPLAKVQSQVGSLRGLGRAFHDLRHAGNTLAATAAASLRELMDRMGHDSERVAMIYLNPRELHRMGEVCAV